MRGISSLSAMALSVVFSLSVTAQDASWADIFESDISPEYASKEHRAFDFWIGEWNMNWRQRPLEEFYHAAEGNWMHHRVFPILGGKAIIELAWDRDKPDTPSQRGFSVRYYDPARESWVMAQNWPNQSGNGLAFLDQLIGKEHLGRLTMYSVSPRRQADGTVVNEHRRYNFADIRPGVSFRWDGSNTPDKGATWYTWTIVDAHWIRDLDPYSSAGASWPGQHQDLLCDGGPHGSFDSLEGFWQGTRSDASGNSDPVKFAAGRLLDGCGVAAVLQEPEKRTFMTFGYADRYESWVTYRLDDTPGTTHAYRVSPAGGEGAVFEEAAALPIVDEFTPYYLSDSFRPTNALRRTVWGSIEEGRIEFREEQRARETDDWQMLYSYELRRR